MTKSLRRLGWVAVIVAVVGLCGGGDLAGAQNAAAGTRAVSEPEALMAKDADPDWDVATVKPSDADEKNAGFHMKGSRMTIQGRTVKDMLMVGYGMQEKQLVGMPGWAASDRWDVDGVPNVPGNPNFAQLQSLVRRILVERFGLKMHAETKEMDIYAMTVAKGGPKLKSAGDLNGAMQENDNDSAGQKTMHVKNATMGDLAIVMNYGLERPVVDQTGLSGRYDFDLKWTVDDSKTPTDGSAAPGLFTAVQEQLGLKMAPVKGTAEVMVIEKVERPSEN